MSVSKPIFVIGTPRSGTTLTAKILGMHPELFMPGETHFFPDIYSRRKNIGEPPGEIGGYKIFSLLSDLYDRYWEPDDQKRVEKILNIDTYRKGLLIACQNGYREALDYFMEMQMQDEGKVRWGNNTPRDLFHVNEIISLYPDAYFIFCVRDLRDFLLSYQQKWKVVPEKYLKRLQKIYHPVITTLLWKASIRKIFELKLKLPTHRWIQLRYEDLVSDPEKSVRKICEIVQINFRFSMLTIDSHNSSYHSTSKGIFTSSIGRWREDLKPTEIKLAQILARSEMQKLDYRLETINANYFELLLLFLSTPHKLFTSIKANSELTGPIVPYIYKRILSLFS